MPRAKSKKKASKQKKKLEQDIVPPSLPVELQQRIINMISEEDMREERETLSSCALVCQAWHIFVLRHRFRSISLYFGIDDISRKCDLVPRSLQLVGILQANTLIPPYTRKLHIEGESDAFLNETGGCWEGDPPLLLSECLLWEAFVNLNSLEIKIEMPFRTGGSDEIVWDLPCMAEKGPVEFLPKAARLPSLYNLSITYSFTGGILMDKDQVRYALHDLIANDLDLYFYDEEDFKALRKLAVAVGLQVWATFKLVVFKGLIEESLPSVFDSAGRVATAALDTKVEPHLYPLSQMDDLVEWL